MPVTVKLKLVEEMKQDQEIHIGLDIALSMNGDETSIDYWRGNKELFRDNFRNQDATILADNIEESFNKRGISKTNKYIFIHTFQLLSPLITPSDYHFLDY